jgi:TonB family protein
MRHIVIALLSLSACATSGALDHPSDPTTGRGSSVQLDFSARGEDAAQPVFPAAIDPRLPSADRVAPRIRQVLGENVTADVDLCVGGDGHVTSATVAKSSSNDAFDRSMLHDINEWQFEATPGAGAHKMCERFTISYRVHR